MKVVIIGAGYVGLVSGCCFAEFGADVTCVDLDEGHISSLKKGRVPIYEPGLDRLLLSNTGAGRLSFTSDMSFAVPTADLVFIAVGTPSRRGDGHADLSYVYSAASELATHLSGYTVVVNKSTVPVGTARQVKQIIATCNPEVDFDVASNPEFLREGAAIADFMRPDRVILGVDSQRAEALLRELYRPLNLIESPIVVTDLHSAELIKYAANSFLATKISFINEMSQLCEKVGADVHTVAKGMGLDGRIGKKFLHPGPGFGGSCLPKDTQALIKMSQDYGVTSQIVEAVVEVNAAQQLRMVAKIKEALGGSEFGKKVAVLGLTFKPETDDMRDAPSLTILPALIEDGALIRAHDPQGMTAAAGLLPDKVTYHDDIYGAAAGADAVVLMTEWNQYRGLDLVKVIDVMDGNVFVDLRNVYERSQMNDAGFEYYCVGR
ncbi:UDP-glucose/GDP-mannose dehydrogenase family protein [Luminiphilus sp.]|nr:UDP-glucose/GDP-mannose dehydrogenase family protein [Luminiphilus sp.]MDA9711463.1 UDP-glucose/GDP-mannose dehydrogenase family protein [Luminiphilus sp.]